jgi:hypothetical protein
MVPTLLTALALGAAALGCASHSSESRGSSVPPPSIKTGRASVNGILMYYEIHGDAAGPPLVLLHGGGSTIDVTWGRILPVFARHRTVIAVEEQGHGRTTDRDAPVRFDSSADDVAALLAALQVPQADVMGFSKSWSSPRRSRRRAARPPRSGASWPTPASPTCPSP